jgi:hypothetical protein
MSEMVIPKKRRAPSDAAVLGSRRSRQEVTDASITTAITAFFGLPRGIRDNIYEHAFGLDPRVFTYAGNAEVLILAFTHFFRPDDIDLSFVKGLPA